VHWESTLDANLERNLANGEGLADALARTTDYDALEDLNTAAVTFDDVYVNLHVVTDAELRNVRAEVWCVYYVKNVHDGSLSVSARRSKTVFV
jgi:hypothetical protein